MMSLYDIEVKRTDQSVKKLEEYKGKVLLVVNTATTCGFTPQYEQLETLYEKYKEQGFEILDFPCNQFASQAQGTNEELSDFCKTNYGTTFETFARLNVNGKNAHPLFKYLKMNTPHQDLLTKLSGSVIKWNFTKFLIDQNGQVIKRYEPIIRPLDIDKDIQALFIK